MDFGKLFTDWESELCDNNSNEVERRTRQKLHTAARLSETIRFYLKVGIAKEGVAHRKISTRKSSCHIIVRLGGHGIYGI